MLKNGVLIDNRENSKYTEEFKARAVQLAHEKGNVRKAAEELNISYWNLNRWYRKVYGHSEKHSKYTEDFKIRAIRLARQKGIQRAAEKLKIPYRTLQRWSWKINDESFQNDLRETVNF